MEENKKELNNSGGIKTVRTYMSDMADTVRNNEGSVIKVALAEQNRNERENIYRQAEGSNSKKIFWVIGGLILIGSALYGSYYLINQKVKDSVPQLLIKNETIISYDETSNINLANADSIILTDKINTIKKEPSASDKNGVIKFLSLTKDVNGVSGKILTKDIFTLMKSTAPSSLVRSLSDSYMLGTYIKNPKANMDTTEGKPSLFMIFQTKDYSFTYAGMLEWEKTIASDMFSLFEFNTKENKIQLSAKPFKDIIINNKDARVLISEENNAILYYLFTNKNNLIVTDSPEAIKEILARLAIKNIKPL